MSKRPSQKRGGLFIFAFGNPMFTPNNLSPHHAFALPREVSYNIPLFLLLTATCTLLLFVYLLYFKKTLQLVQGVFSYNSSRQLQREGYSFFKFFSMALTAVYIICISIFFADLNERLRWISLPNENLLLPGCILFLVCLLAVKRISPLIFSFFLQNQKALNDYFFQYSFSIKTEGLLLFPVCLLLHYSTIPQEYLLPLGLLIPVVIFSVRVVRTIIWGRAEYGFSLFHIVLYLCTVEIIPLVVFIKILVAGWLRFS
jgi:hypothetical protein